MKIYPFQAIIPNFDLISSPELFFSTVKHDYPEYRANGFFRDTDSKAFYIYQIQTNVRSHLGLVACLDIEAYIEGRIIKHEHTLAAKEQTMMNLHLQRQAMVKPVLLGYQPLSELQSTLRKITKNQEPFFSVEFDEDEQWHHYYKVSDETLQAKLRNLFEQHVDRLYIADGHHRCSTMAKLFRTLSNTEKSENKYRHLLCALFPFDQLDIHDYNRVIEALGEISPTRLIAELSRVFEMKFLKKPSKPRKKHELTLYINHEWYRLNWRKSVLEKHAHRKVLLDTYLLNKEVIEKIIGFQDSGNDPRIKYVEGISGLQGFIDQSIRSSRRFGFCVYPISTNDWLEISDRSETLPPKSTWFEPRIRNGLIVKGL